MYKWSPIINYSSNCSAIGGSRCIAKLAVWLLIVLNNLHTFECVVDSSTSATSKLNGLQSEDRTPSFTGDPQQENNNNKYQQQLASSRLITFNTITAPSKTRNKDNIITDEHDQQFNYLVTLISGELDNYPGSSSPSSEVIATNTNNNDDSNRVYKINTIINRNDTSNDGSSGGADEDDYDYSSSEHDELSETLQDSADNIRKQQQLFSNIMIPTPPIRLVYPVNISKEDELRDCDPYSVCNKIDTFNSQEPWLERQCRCKNSQCSMSLDARDGKTIRVDKNKQLKLCESTKDLPTCAYFNDITWTLIKHSTDNSISQHVHCKCPTNSVAYLRDHRSLNTSQQQLTNDNNKLNNQNDYIYLFACSPETRLKCQPKEPCKLYSVRKLPFNIEDITTNILCQCRRGYSCPDHYNGSAVFGENINNNKNTMPSTPMPKQESENQSPSTRQNMEQIMTFSAFCMAN